MYFQYEFVLFILFTALCVGLGSWLGYLVTGGLIFWWKYEKGSFDFDSAPAGNWPKIAIVAVIDETAEKPWLSLQSALTQNYPSKEIIVVANGISQDMLAQSLEQLNGECFRIIELKSKASLSTIFNTAANLTDAETIFFADPGVHMGADTVTKLSMQMYEDSRVGVVFARKKVVGGGLYSAVEYFLATVKNLAQMSSRVYGKLGATDEQCALFRKTALKDIGFFSKSATHIISHAGWKVQLKFWSARFESKAEYWTKPVSSLKEILYSMTKQEQLLNFNRKKFGKMLKNKQQMRFWPNYLATFVKKIFGLISFFAIGFLIFTDNKDLNTASYRELLSVLFLTVSITLGFIGTILYRNKNWWLALLWLPLSAFYLGSKLILSALFWKSE